MKSVILKLEGQVFFIVLKCLFQDDMPDLRKQVALEVMGENLL
jgi:hypothetical protein